MEGAIRVLREEDIDFAVSVCALEGWDYESQDIRRIQELEPAGCFVAWRGEVPVGFVSTAYYGTLAWIGNVIVVPEARKGGVGAGLVRHALNYLQDRGAQSVRLESYLKTIAFYDHLGFQKEFPNRRFEGLMEGARSLEVQPFLSQDLEEVARFDEWFFGVDRARYLDRWQKDFPKAHWLYREAGELRGFVGGTTSGSYVEVGPLVALPRHPEVACALLETVAQQHPGKRLALSVPAPNVPSAHVCEDFGMKETFWTMRSFFGKMKPAGEIQGVYALGGLERG